MLDPIITTVLGSKMELTSFNDPAFRELVIEEGTKIVLSYS